MPSIGPLEIGIVLVVVLLVFGPKRLPDLGKSLGQGMREFKESLSFRSDGDGPVAEPIEPTRGDPRARSG